MASKSITKEINGRMCLSTSFLAGSLGVTRKSIAEWEKRGCPKAAYGYYDLEKVLAWREEQSSGKAHTLIEGKDITQYPLTTQKIYWEARCREAQAENQGFKNAILRGDYIEKQQAEKDLVSFFTVFKQAALSLPRKAAIVAAQYVGNEKARALEKDMTEAICDVLAQWSHGDLADPAGPATE